MRKLAGIVLLTANGRQTIRLSYFDFTHHFGLGMGLAGSDVVFENTGSDTRIKVDPRQTSLTLNTSLAY